MSMKILKKIIDYRRRKDDGLPALPPTLRSNEPVIENQSPAQYQKQHRGNAAAYEAYFRGMDASMQQKIALTTAHFPSHGRIVDMGSGSGRGTFDLACLYDGLEMIGIDINPMSVEMSRRQFSRQNLSYVVGDISEKVFLNESLDGILNSSVLHHVTSFNNFDVRLVLKALDNQVAQLRPNGVLIIRDFVIPDGPAQVYLDLPRDDGEPAGEIKKLSTAALFERFAQEFRSSVNPTGPVPFDRMVSRNASSFNRYRVALRAATEFVLRKDYRADWATEIIEEYTYLSQQQFEQAFRERGLRIVVSMPIWNPWIVQNRFVGKFFLYDLNESLLPFPPTNYLIVGEKVSQGSGVELMELEREEITEPKFLSLKTYRDKRNGQIWELAERPNRTIDLLPWFEDEGQIFVLARKDYPRPIVNACPELRPLHSAGFSGYLTEPISALVSGREDTATAIIRILQERAGLSESDIVTFDAGQSYFTSAGGIDEYVTSCTMQISHWERQVQPAAKTTPFIETGLIRELDAIQVLRASNVGGMFDARLEINIYRLLRLLNRSVGPWIGASLDFAEQKIPDTFQFDSETTLSSESQSAFEECEGQRANFLTLRSAKFVECDAKGSILAQAEFEYVVPRDYSEHTVIAAPVIKTSADAFIGLEHRHLPAAQRFTGNPRIVCVPAWRLPKTVAHISELEQFVSQALKRDFNLVSTRTRELGGAYFTSPGVTPELVYPLAIEVNSEDVDQSPLNWISLKELIKEIDSISDAHTLIAAYRMAHALGVLTL